MAITKTHSHEYIKDSRPGWGGVICRVCGLRVSQLLVHLPSIQARLVKEDQ